MKNNYFSSKNYKSGLVVLLLLFCGLFSNEAMAQPPVLAANDTFVWTGLISTDWAITGNWTIIRGTAAGSNSYPGESTTNDVVYVNKSDTPFKLILDFQNLEIARLLVNNNFGGEAGATFTINPGATLNVGNNTAQSNNVLLNGGNIVNNGTLNIKATGVGFTNFPSIGINCGNPITLPSVPTEYSYSGSGTLNIDLPLANFAGAAAIAVLGNNNPVSNGATPPVFTTPPVTTANATYRFVLNNPAITFNQATLLAIGAIRAAGGNNANKLIIGGTGFTIGTVGTPSIGGLINAGGGSTVVIEATTTLTLNSAAANLNAAVGGFSSNTTPCNVTNKGTINIVGSSARSGLNFSTAGGSNGPPVVPSPLVLININNEGTLNVNLNVVTPGFAAFSIGNGGGIVANPGTLVSLNNSGTMILKNTATALGTGFPIYTFTGGEAARLLINNSGTMTIDGTTYAFCSKTTLNNSSILNTNSELRSFTAVNNNLGGTINFVRNAATATTKQVNFTVTSTDTSGGVGSIFRDSNNNDYAVVSQKFGTGTSLLTNVLSSATTPATGTLTRITGTGTASIIYTAAGVAPVNNAIAGTLTNSGTINTDTAANLNILSAPTTTATSVLSPGGANGKGVLTIPTVPTALNFTYLFSGTLKMQASGSATAGVDYDTMQMLGAEDFIDITAATLDVTGLYTPAAITTIDIITTGANGGVTKPFANVVGLPSGWAVVYTPNTGGKVQLSFDPANLATDKFTEAQFSYYPNPTRNELNVTAAKTISKVELFNLLGQKVQSHAVNANQKQLSIANLQNGMYLMEVTIDNAKQAFKIIKK